MRKLALCLALLGAFQAYSQAGKDPSLNYYRIADELKEGVDAVVRFHDETVEILNANDAIHTVRVATTVLNEKGAEKDGYIAIFYDNFYYKLGQLSAGIYDKYGNLVKKIKKKDLIDRSTGVFEVVDTRVKTYKPGAMSYPYTVYYEYTERLSGLMFLPPWRPINRTQLSLESGSFTVKVPKNLDIRYKELGGVELLEKEEAEGNYVYKWEMKDMEPVEVEPYTPHVVLPSVMLDPNEFEIAGYQGKAESWKDFGLFHYNLNKGREVVSPGLASKVQQMTANANSNHEKVNILYKYMQENTRYRSIQLGIGGFQSMTAQKVEETGYGDCKALTYFMKGMLAEIDIPSYACLIYRGRKPRPVRTDFVSTQFNHALLCVPQGEDTIWVECTNDDIPAGYLSNDDDDRFLLLLTEDGGLIRRTPTPDPEDNLQFRAANIKLGTDGRAVVKVKSKLVGNQQDYIRYMTTHMDQREKEEWLYDRLNVSSVEINAFSIDKSKDRPECALTYDLSARKWAKSSGNRLFLKLHQLEDLNSIPPQDDARKKPVVWRRAFLEEDSIFIDLPQGYVIESMGDKEILIERPYGSYRASIDITDQGDLIYRRRWELDKCFLEPEEYEGFRKFFKEVRKADQQQVVLSKRS